MTTKLAPFRVSPALINASSIQHDSTEVPPLETKGKVTPVNGRISTEPKTFSASWMRNILAVAQAAME